MFILNDVNLSNYGRGRDRTKRKSRSLRNAAIGVGALAVAGGLGYMALKGKGKSVTQPSISKPPVTTVNKPPVISAKRKANSELVAKRKQLLEEENIKNRNDSDLNRQVLLDDKIKNRKGYIDWDIDVNIPNKPYIENRSYSITKKPKYVSYKNHKYRDEIIRSKKQEGSAIKQIARNLRRDNRYFSRCSNIINLTT